MNKRQDLNDASSEREAYSAPNYERFAFETSGLMKESEEVFGVSLGDIYEQCSNAEGEF